MLTLWKKSYDKPRDRIKKQRYYFACKGPYSQSYGFSTRLVYILVSVSRSVMSNYVTPWIVARQAPLSMKFSRQEYWSGVAISFSRGSSQPNPVLQLDSLPSETPVKPFYILIMLI